MKGRKKQRSRKEVVKIGMAWYRPEQWSRLRQISEDVDILETNYEEWENLALQKIGELETAGIKIEKVEVDIDELLSYCEKRGLKINADSRSSFVAEELRKRDQKEGRAS